MVAITCKFCRITLTIRFLNPIINIFEARACLVHLLLLNHVLRCCCHYLGTTLAFQKLFKLRLIMAAAQSVILKINPTTV